MRLRPIFFVLSALLSFNLMSQTAPDFNLITSTDEGIELYNDYLNQGTTVVIELFFVACPPCQSFAPHMASLYESLIGENVNVEFISLSTSTGDSDEEIEGFKNEFNHNWPFVGPTGGSIDASLVYRNGTFGQYFGTPAVIVISPDGTVEYITRIFNDNNAYAANVGAAVMESQNIIVNMPPATAIIAGGINTTGGDGLGGVLVKFSGAKDTTIISDENGNFQTGSLLADESYTIALEKNTNHVNGVTTLDIVLIAKHILGIDPFSSEHQIIAADVNRSGAVTAFDIVQIRQLILGITKELPNTNSWVFDPPGIALTSLNDLENLAFTGIKIGDLNNSANPNELLMLEERNQKDNFIVQVSDQYFKAGDLVEVPIYAKDIAIIEGFQFTFEFDTDYLELSHLLNANLNNLGRSNFNFQNKNRGYFTTSWNAPVPQNNQELFALSFIAQKDGILSDFLNISSSKTIAEAYGFNNNLYNVNLEFNANSKEILTSAKIFPNPSMNENVFLAFDNLTSKEIQVLIADMNGKIISSSKYKLNQAGKQLLDIETTGLPTGVYSVRLMEGTKMIHALRLVRQ